jgi:hypothetical protein
VTGRDTADRNLDRKNPMIGHQAFRGKKLRVSNHGVTAILRDTSLHNAPQDEGYFR